MSDNFREKPDPLVDSGIDSLFIADQDSLVSSGLIDREKHRILLGTHCKSSTPRVRETRQEVSEKVIFRRLLKNAQMQGSRNPEE